MLFFVLTIVLLLVIFGSSSLVKLRKILTKIWKEYDPIPHVQLTLKEKRILNQIQDKPNDPFFEFDFCLYESLKLFIQVYREFKQQWHGGKKFTNQVFNLCKYAVKQQYAFPLPPENEITHLKEQISTDIQTYIQSIAATIRPLTEEEEKKLFVLDANRWKARYAYLIETFTIENKYRFYEDICKLVSLDRRIVTQRNIFFKAYLYMVKPDQELSVMLYVNYLNINTLQHKDISPRNRKLLFRTKEQEESFDRICQEMSKTHDLSASLKAVKPIFAVKRRKININEQGIRDAGKDHAGVVELLNEYLADDELSQNPVTPEKVPEIQKPIPGFSPSGNLPSTIQKELLLLFAVHAFQLNKKEVDTFARSKGVLKNQLIESINELYYETLDDILIEEEEDDYLVNQDYYQQINTQ